MLRKKIIYLLIIVMQFQNVIGHFMKNLKSASIEKVNISENDLTPE